MSRSDQVFAYVYGNSALTGLPPERYATDLAKLLPRIPNVAECASCSTPSPNPASSFWTCI